MSKTYEEQKHEHDIEMARLWALEDLGHTGDLRGFLGCLRSGNVDEDILRVAANLIETHIMTETYQRKVAKVDAEFWRANEIRSAFEHREIDVAGRAVVNPLTSQQLADKLAKEYGFNDARQVFNILRRTGYVSPKRGGPPPVTFVFEEDDQ